jgi:hypothetical protein
MASTHAYKVIFFYIIEIMYLEPLRLYVELTYFLCSGPVNGFLCFSWNLI